MKRQTNYPFSKALYYLCFTLCLLSIKLSAQQFGPPNVLTHAISPGDFGVADFDNDGDMDVIMGSFREASFPENRVLAWYENTDGTGENWTVYNFENDVENSGVAQIVVGDFNDDGWMDFVTWSGHLTITYDAFLYTNNGTTDTVTFTKNELNIGHDLAEELEAGDLNGDGKLDLVISGSRIIYRTINEGDSNFSFLLEIDELPLSQGYFKDIELDDVDADGDLDIIATANVLGDNDDWLIAVYWYENLSGVETFSAPILVGEHACTDCGFGDGDGFDIETADFNQDGRLDVFVSSDPALIYYQGNNQSFSVPVALQSGTGLEVFTEYQARDMDGDNDPDLVRMGTYDGQFCWFRNLDGDGDFEPVCAGNMRDPSHNYSWGFIADLEGDGDVDYFYEYGPFRVNGIFVFRDDEGDASTFINPIKISDNLNGSFQVIDLDLDEDNDLDLLYLATDEGNLYWQENLDGLGNFSLPNLLIYNDQLKAFDLQDFDGDGDLDICASWRGNAVAGGSGIFVYERLDDTLAFFKQTELNAESNIRYADIYARDFDADGDLDLIYEHYSQNTAWRRNLGNWNFGQDSILVPGELVGLANIDGNTFPDVCYVDGDEVLHVVLRSEGTNDVILSLNPDYEYFFTKIIDLDEDGDEDLVSVDRDTDLLLFFENDNGAFTEHVLFDDLSSGLADIADFDGDGKLDIIGRWQLLRQQTGPTDFGELDFDIFNFSGRIHQMADFDTDGELDFLIAFENDGLLWRENLIPLNFLVEGNVFHDLDEDCIYAAPDTSLYGWIVTFQKDNTSTYSVSTSPLGNYSGYLPDSGEYTVNVVRPSAYWRSCVVDTVLAIYDTAATYAVNFPVQAEMDCPLLGLNSAGTNLRPCIEGAVTFSYCNYGTAPAENAQLEIQPETWLEVNGSSIPWASTTDSTYIFDLGDIAVGACGSVHLYVTPDCDTIEVGDIACVAAYLSPDSICLPQDTLWDGSTIEASGFCTNDSIVFQLRNIGEGNMAEARYFRIEYIVNDDIVMLIDTDTFHLAADEEKIISLPPGGAELIRIEADQDEFHPLVLNATAMVANCALPGGPAFPADLISNFPDEDGNPFAELYCREITGSYDPNIKEALPAGIGEGFIDADWELDYTIHFQNTGNDTAFTVIIKDQISEHLDLTTLRIGAASHDFVWALSLDRELSFTFNNILLPDSTTNQLLSQGYVQFSIMPKADLPVLTQIDNYADIYFDSNAPITTDIVSRTIRKPIFSESAHYEVCSGGLFDGWPIVQDTTIVDTTMDANGCYLFFNHLTALSTTFWIDTLIESGGTYAGIMITQDTLIVEMGVDENECETTTYVQVYTTTNTHQVDDALSLAFFPNPATDQVHLDLRGFETEQTMTYTILDMNGLPQQTGRLSSPTVEVSALPPGVYIFELTAGHQRGIGKLILY